MSDEGRTLSWEEALAAQYAAFSEHVCQPPTVESYSSVPLQPDWTCAVCERVWRDQRTATGMQWWAEIRGPAVS